MDQRLTEMERDKDKSVRYEMTGADTQADNDSSETAKNMGTDKTAV